MQRARLVIYIRSSNVVYIKLMCLVDFKADSIKWPSLFTHFCLYIRHPKSSKRLIFQYIKNTRQRSSKGASLESSSKLYTFRPAKILQVLLLSCRALQLPHWLTFIECSFKRNIYITFEF